ncbi:MAG: hypothetical protein RLZZ210_182 [Pseudomonadota bacterium]|jgi:preprotein translocase subunit YajC
MSIFISEAVAQTASGAAASSSLTSLLPILGIFVFMYFFVMRPQLKKQKEQQKLIANITKGDEVITIGGILGKVSKVNDSYISIEIGNNLEIKCQKSAVSHVLPKGTIKEIE